MDDDYDNYVPQISTMDWQNLGGTAGSGGQEANSGASGGGNTAFLYDGGVGAQSSGGQYQQQQQRGFPGMTMQGTQPQQFGGGGVEYGGMGGTQQYQASGFVAGPAGMQSAAAQMAAAQQQMQQRQMMGGMQSQFGQSAPAGYSMPLPAANATAAGGKAAQTGKGKGSKRSKKAAAAEAANSGQTSSAVEQQQSHQQQQFPMQGQMGFYYKGGPGPGPPTMPGQPMMVSPSSGGHPQQQQMAGKWPYQQPTQQHEDQQQQQRQQQFAQQQQMAAQQSQQQAQQHYGPLQHLQSQYGAGGQQHPQQSQYVAYAQQQQQLQAAQQKQPQQGQTQEQSQPKSAMPGMPGGQQPGHGMPQTQQQQAAAYYGQQQQYPQQQQQQAGPYMGMTPQQQQQAGAAYPMGAYPPGYAANAAMQKQAYYAQQQMMAAGAAQVGPGGMPYYQQPYGLPNPYVLQQQQQQIYRELFECDQQLGSLMPQAQQNPEVAMRVEKLQMHRQFLHSQLMQLQQAAAAAAAAAAAGGAPPMGMPSGSREAPQQGQPPQSVQYQYPQSQQAPGSVAVQQKLPPNSQPPPPYPPQYPPAPGPAGFHSPGAPQSVPQHQQPPTPQQAPQPMAQPQYAAPPSAPHLSSPSVAVMSASNQVQVNIRPEITGRTMISVYHSPDIPSSNIQPAAVVSSAAMPPYSMAAGMQMQPSHQHQAQLLDQNAQNLSAKDSIPPEPLPPNLAQEQKRRQQQLKQRELEQQQQAELQQQQQMQANQSGSQSQQQQLQPSPPNTQPKQLPPQPAKPKTPPMVTAGVSMSFVSPAGPKSAYCCRVFDIVPKEVVALNVEEVKEKVVVQPVAPEPEPVEPQPEPEKTKEPTPIPEHPLETELKTECTMEAEEEEKPSEISELLNHELQQLERQHQKRTASIAKIEKEAKEEKQKPEEEGNEMEEAKKKKSAALETANLLVGNAGLERETLTPSTSDPLLEAKADDMESTADDSQWPGTSTKETTPQDAEDFPFSFRATKGSTSGKPSTSGSKNSSKLRKKRKMDWNRDEDDDYVGSKKKKQKTPAAKREEKIAMELEAEAAELDEDFLLETRRSVRKSTTGKKTKYGEDSENDDALGEPLPQEPTIVEPLEEKVVEKILGVRLAKRMVKKKKVQEEVAEKPKQVAEEQKEDQQKKETEEAMKEEPTNEDKMEASQENEKKPEEANEAIEEKDEEKKLPQEAEEKFDEVEEEVEELYIKFKGYSYLHCEWKTLEELEELGDKRVLGKLNRWKQKFGDAITVAGEDDEQEYFNEDYTVVARVLDETYDEQEQQHYVFVKWKALPYEDCTWENIQDVPEQKMAEFQRRIEFDPCKGKEQPRLSPKEWSSRLAIPKDRLYKNDNVLREYQHEGVNWLLWTWTNGRNCILADEMGLGKTVQTIVFFQSLYDIGIHGPFLVVVPLSTLGNWEREFENWTDINAIVYHGGAHSRKIIQEYEFFYKKTDTKKRIPKFDALITTYEVVVQEVEVLKRINFRVCVIDEAHRIKNRNCKLLQTGLLSLRMEHRVLLTGTPLQNNIQELFSLLNFLEPEQFANSGAFLQQFGQCQTEEQVQKLQEILKPMMLRRLKEDVEKELQPKEETIIEVQLSNIQKKYYRAVLERNFTHLMKGTTPSLINTMMQLRKCCNHPYLINGAEEQILSELKLSHQELSEEQLQHLGLITSSGKVVLIDKLLPKLHADGHKVLIFSQMVRVLDLLEEYLNIKGYPFERIDGNIRGNERQAAIDRFSKPENKDRFVFLLCTRAGGLGINLTAADTVIIFDSDWNPQNDLQAQARCHRIGQTKPVKIYRLITSNTYEREMFDKASLKLGLDKAVLQSMLHRGSDTSQQMSRQEVEDLLRKGAYGAIMDEDNEGTKFSEEDIDTILQRRTQTIRLEPGVKGSTFAKASFTTSHNRDDIDIGDPDFWSKWAKKANIDVDSLHEQKHLIVHEPRSRKKRFEAENFKGNSESGDEGGSDDDERQSTPGASRIAEGVKSRSARKKRRAGANAGGEDDDDYAYKPDELAFSKTVYFKVEKLLTQWGWGRWQMLKQSSELTENELEHISRTLLLHCIREFRGDEKTQECIWALITPAEPKGEAIVQEAIAKVEKPAKPGTSDSKSKFHQGWAALPEYNPPFICVDMTFQRHLHRHSNKLLNRIQHLHFLHTQIFDSAGEEPNLKVELPDQLDSWLIMPQWDRQCDCDLLLGIEKHGMENWEQIRTDPKLCFTSRSINFPNTLDLNNRFKYLISVLQRRVESQGPSTSSLTAQLQANKPEVKWTKVEESDFMRILRNYGVKDDTNSENVINWSRFRDLSICLKNKTDSEMLEMLYCVLAMCTKQQGGLLSPVDERRADRVEAIPAGAAEKLMNRLHLMRKVHAIITMGINNIKGMLKMVSLDVMPKGWTESHDEHLLIVVDKFGLEDIHGKLKCLPKLFDTILPLPEKILLRRVMEICSTLENGKWSGPAVTTGLEDEPLANQPSSSNSTVVKKAGAAGAGNGRRRADQQKQKSGTADKIGAGTAATKPSTSAAASNKGGVPAMSYNEQQMLMKMMEQMSNPQYLLQLMTMMGGTPSTGAGTSSSSTASTNAALQQQFQQLQTLLTLTALSGTGSGASSADLSALTASLASLAGMSTGAGTSGTNISTQKPTTSATISSSSSADVLNLSKRTGTSTNASDSAKSAVAKPAISSAGAIKSAYTSADACLSTGLSTAAINKLSQMSVPELLAYSNLSQETRIPVVHSDTQQRLEGDKAPTLKELDGWLKTHTKFTVDLLTLATSHPSLFSNTPNMPLGPSGTSGGSLAKTPTTPVSAQKPKLQTTIATTPTTPTTSTPKAERSTASTQQQQLLIDQTKKSITGSNASSSATNASSKASSSAANTLSSAMTSLFGMDLQGANATAQSTAALNQFLTGLTNPSSAQSLTAANQLHQSLNAAAGGTQTASASSLKSMEQQLMLLQQAALLGSANSFNPYAALLYQNPADLFGVKSTSSSASTSSNAAAANALASSLLNAATGGQSSSSTAAALSAAMNDASTMAAAAALAQAAAGTTGTAANDLNAALTSELYMAAMASSLPSFLGTTSQQPSSLSQTAASNALAANTAASSLSSAAALEQLLAAAGIGNATGLGLGVGTTTSTILPKTSQPATKTTTLPTVSTPNLLLTPQQPTRNAESPSMAKKSGSTGAGGRGLKLNAVLEKLASSSAGISAAASPSASGMTSQSEPAESGQDEASKEASADEVVEKNPIESMETESKKDEEKTD